MNIKDFQNKTICFLGDSIMQHGHFIYAIRSYFHYDNINCVLYNRGIGGNRADMIQYLIKDEILTVKPDYCFICYGVNDLGIWLYDSFKEIDAKNLANREKRYEAFKNGIISAVKILKGNNVTPILMSPYPVDENLEENQETPTLGDNKEKQALIEPWFYKRATFKNINKALAEYSAWLKDFAEEQGVLFYDNFTSLKNKVKLYKEVFNQDGIHYSEKGHGLIAQGLLEFMGFSDVLTNWIKDQANDEIFKLEQEERSVAFVRFGLFNERCSKKLSNKEMLANIKEYLKDKGLAEWQKKTYTDFINHYGKFELLRDLIVEKTEKYLKR